MKDEAAVYRRGRWCLVFNFHPTSSYTDLRSRCLIRGLWLVLDSDSREFEGQGRVAEGMHYPCSIRHAMGGIRACRFICRVGRRRCCAV